ncbi:MAG: hypothetical protein WC054_13480 [Candidatus Nanopelagicales bacterium]
MKPTKLHHYRGSAALAGGLVIVATSLVGCTAGTDSETSASEPAATRGAAGTVTCPELGGPKDAPSYADFSTRYSVPITFVNDSSIPLVLNASEIDCYDFSGAQNPSVFDGAKVTAGSSIGPYTVIARRTCAYVQGDIIGKFQTREARWKTTVSASSEPGITGTIPTVIDCSSFGQSPTMCRSGAGQDRAAYTVKLTNGSALRADFTCEDNATTITLSDLY